MYIKRIYFSGGSFYELQEVFSRIKGVVATKVGYINSADREPSCEKVLKAENDTVMGVQISYNPKKIDLSTLMDILFAVVSPYTGKRSGVYYCDEEDRAVVEFYMSFIKTRSRAPAAAFSCITVNDSDTGAAAVLRCRTKGASLGNFYPAEERHQYYLRKNPTAKTFIDFMRLRELDIIAEREC